MLYRDKKTFHFAVFVLLQTKDNTGLQERESEQQARWSAENSQKETEAMPGTGNI